MHLKDLFSLIHNSTWATNARATHDARALRQVRVIYNLIRSTIQDPDASHQVEDLHNHIKPEMARFIREVAGVAQPQAQVNEQPPHEVQNTTPIGDTGTGGTSTKLGRIIALIDAMEATLKEARAMLEEEVTAAKRQRRA
jgi:hypothetical protein